MSEQEVKIPWGFQVVKYTHPVQIVAREFQDDWDSLKEYQADFQGMTKDQMVNFSGAIIGNWTRCLKKAKELPDDGKKPSEFPAPVDVTKEGINNLFGKLTQVGLTPTEK